MTKKIKKLYKSSRNDKSFIDDLRKHEPKYCKIDWFFSDNEKIIIATIYMGWLLGKGQYNEEDFI